MHFNLILQIILLCFFLPHKHQCLFSNRPTQPDGLKNTSTLLFESTFEDIDVFRKWSREANSNSITRTTVPVRAGKYAAKFIIRKSDSLVAGSYRAELKQEIMPVNAERWYGLSIYLPGSYIPDNIPESLFQWHNVPNFNSGEHWGKYKFQNPFRLETNNGRLYFVHQYSSIPSYPNSPVQSKAYDLGAYETGKWIDWVVHFKLSFKEDGLLEIWKDRKKVLTLTGPNYYNDESGPYFKMGIYKWGWSRNKPSQTEERIVYFDEVRVGSAESSFEQVSPRADLKNSKKL